MLIFMMELVCSVSLMIADILITKTLYINVLRSSCFYFFLVSLSPSHTSQAYQGTGDVLDSKSRSIVLTSDIHGLKEPRPIITDSMIT